MTTAALPTADVAFAGNRTTYAEAASGGHNVLFWEAEFGFWRFMAYAADGSLSTWTDGPEGDRSEAALRAVLVETGATRPDAEIDALVAGVKLHGVVSDEDGDTVAEASAGTDDALIAALWSSVACDVGPLANKPASLSDLGDTLADACACSLVVDSL